MQATCLPGDKPLGEAVDREWWIARMGGTPVGFCAMSSIGQGIAYLELVGVVPWARGRGLQRRLMAVALRFARKSGFSTAISYTANWNHASSNNFIAGRWQLYTPEYKWGWADGLYWRKTLCGST